MNRKGMGLVEILVAVAIGVIVFTGIAASLYYLFIMNESTKNQTRIYQDMSAVMERIDNTSMKLLTTRYPSGTLSNSEIDLITNENGYQVTGESISVSYPGGTSDDPVEVVVTASWNDRGRPKTMAVRTFKRG